MGNTEDYLDSLLNNINNGARSGKSLDMDAPLEDANEAFRRFEREQEYKREQRRRKEEEQRKERAFLEYFEGQLEGEDIDDFLEQFELELEAEKGDDLEKGTVDNSNFFQNIEGIVSDATTENGAGKEEKEQPVEEKQESISKPEEEEEPLLEESLFMEEPEETPLGEMDSEAKEPEYATEELMLEGEGEADLLDLLSGMQDDDDISEIGDLLKADQDNIELEEAAMEMQKKSEMQAGTTQKKEASSKKKDKKKGFFGKLVSALFGDEEQETETKNVAVPENEELENISEENLQILKELEAAEQAGGKDAKEDKKGKKKKAKKEKKEKKPKEKKEKKPRVKKEKPPKPPKEEDHTPPLPKKAVMLIFLLAFSILFFVILMSKIIGYSSQIDMAKQAVDNGEYVEAYRELDGLELKEKDEKLYEEIKAMALVQAQRDAYQTLMGANEYDLALDALIRGIGHYDKEIEVAQKYGRENEMNDLKAELEQALENQFDMSIKDARKIYAIKDREDYSLEIEKIIDKLNLRQVEE